MGLTTAERNKRKRERKKLEREEQRKLEEEQKAKEEEGKKEADLVEEVEIEYVAEPVIADGEFEVLKRFQERAAASILTADDEERPSWDANNDGGLGEEDDGTPISKRKLREQIRPTVADLKREVERPDVVEAHDITASDPHFLIHLKSVPGTVPVPRHWGRKRKYLQGKVRAFGNAF
jgi:splicing factor 3B subunit 2